LQGVRSELVVIVQDMVMGRTRSTLETSMGLEIYQMQKKKKSGS
jgi:hypothetical protein